MTDFENLEHRLEYVLTVHGIDFINVLRQQILILVGMLRKK